MVLVQGHPRVGSGEPAQLAAEDRLVAGRGQVDVGHIGERATSGERAKHPHHRRDAAAGGHEQQRLLEALGQDEVAGRRGQADDRAGPRVARELLGDEFAWHRLDDAPVAPARHRGQRVGAPVARAVHVDAHAEVLSREMLAREGDAGPQAQGRRVRGLGDDRLDAPARLSRRP